MNFESVLIITYGRSGSTLLQGLLNSIDGCVVRGENYNMCYGLFLAWQSIRNTKLQYGGDSSLAVTEPWFGASLLDEQRFLEDARALVHHQLVPGNEAAPQCVGFKEIRYLPADSTRIDLVGYLDFLEKLFPSPAFIVLTRDHEQVAKSAWWKTMNQDKVKSKFQAFEKETAAYAKGKQNVFSIDYRDMTNRTGKLRQLFEFLGAPYIEDEVERILSIKHSTTPKSGKTAPRAAQNVLNQHYRTEKIACPLLAHFSLDPIEEPGEAGHSVTLKGVAALNASADGEYRLVVKDAAGEHAVTWGLPSPMVAKTHHAARNAGTARFKREGLQLVRGGTAELWLVDKRGGRQCLARIRLK
jgi:sulfotransferase family protein